MIIIEQVIPPLTFQALVIDRLCEGAFRFKHITYDYVVSIEPFHIYFNLVRRLGVRLCANRAPWKI